MGQKPDQLSRRDLFKVGTAVAGAALLPASVAHLATQHRAGESQAAAVPSSSKPTPPPAANTPSAFSASVRPSKSQQPNIVLIVLDTVRVDHLSCYGYRRETTPNIDAFAAGARRYTNVLSPSPFTLPAHAALFTGLSTSAHGADWLHWSLDERFDTLAGQLAAKGYETVGLASNGVFVSREAGFDRGFQTFWNPGDFRPASPSQPGSDDRWDNTATRATEMHNRLAKWFADESDEQKPFFLFMNYLEAHQPYLPPPELLQFASTEAWNRCHTQMQAKPQNLSALLFDHMLTGADLLSSKDIADLESLYDDGIRYVDTKVGELLAFLKAADLMDNTLIIITADHGEHFGEHHLMDHQFSLYEPLVRVPLIVRYADRFKAGEEAALVQNHDVYPTILELAGIPWKPLPGQTCQSLLQPHSGSRDCITEYLCPAAEVHRASITYRKADFSRFAQRLRAIQREKMKLICPSDGKPELYDLASDPAESRNLAAEKPKVVDELSGALDAWVRSFDHYVCKVAPSDAVKLKANPSPDALKQMRGLGYIQ